MAPTNRGDRPSPPARPPRGTRCLDRSPTRATAVDADQAPWPWWADVPIDLGGLDLLDEIGHPITKGEG